MLSTCLPAWGGFMGCQEGLRARKKGRVLVQSHLFPSLLNTVGLPITNGGIKSLSSPPSLKMVFYSPVNVFIECPAEVRVFSISRGARDQGLAPEFASLPTLSFLLNLAAPSPAPSISWKPPQAGLSVSWLVKGSRNVVVLFAKLAGTHLGHTPTMRINHPSLLSPSWGTQRSALVRVLILRER